MPPCAAVYLPQTAHLLDFEFALQGLANKTGHPRVRGHHQVARLFTSRSDELGYVLHDLIQLLS